MIRRAGEPAGGDPVTQSRKAAEALRYRVMQSRALVAQGLIRASVDTFKRASNGQA